ncbi:heme exporter protein CcmD [uncultured Azohydromonas sp.]|jgi:heme exporter protein CcmD|uniref:heme exporter protein CcmD n=1 Tax=uncultured Azohydromonas sp. TaxID=487342 RepID=UPI00262874A5|nr:heme exporter protein CcmD [uncultured Azohydromonas sp.]
MSGGWLTWAAMGGHGGYVWASVGALAVLVGGEVVALRRRHRRALHDIARRPS